MSTTTDLGLSAALIVLGHTLVAIEQGEGDQKHFRFGVSSVEITRYTRLYHARSLPVDALMHAQALKFLKRKLREASSSM